MSRAEIALSAALALVALLCAPWIARLYGHRDEAERKWYTALYRVFFGAVLLVLLYLWLARPA